MRYDSTMNQKATAKLHTLDLKPRSREAIKPAELIQVTGHHLLTLNARRAITILWYNAHLQGIQEGRDYTVEIDDLKQDSHKGYERVEEAVEALMRTSSPSNCRTAKPAAFSFWAATTSTIPTVRPAS